MCGIAGFVSKKFSEDHLRRMTNILQHRGPDAEGFFFDPGNDLGIGHRRLSILDLSTAANQPFYSRDGRYAMVYNGEVYNFREIKAKYNISARTGSDTEIIIEAYAKAGIDCVNDFNGMFALAIWDRDTKELCIIRDRIGIKPVYYYYDNNDFAFASELKALFTLPFSRLINKNAITDFLYLGYMPGNETIYNNCYKLKPGCYAVLKNGKLTISNYWNVEDNVTNKTVQDEAKAKKELKSLVETSVEYCMISDVPVGVFLSGGIDSSIVAAAAQAVSPGNIDTFSIGFKEKKYNEAHFADEVAKHIGSNHHEFTVTETDALGEVEKLLDVYDEPYADSSAIPTLLVSRLASKHVKVALTGDGGDELFMGYGFYYWARRLSNPLLKTLRKPLAKALYTFGDNRLKRGSYLFAYEPERIKSNIFSQEQYFFSEREITALLQNPGRLTIEENSVATKRKLTEIEEQSFFDIKNYLPEELLVKTDRASMYHSLEVRVPLLDHRLVEYALNVAPQLKLRGNTGKYLLKQVLFDYIPASLFDRPKWGFSIPLGTWLGNELNYLLEKYLSREVIEECGLVNAGVALSIKKEFLNGRDYLYNRLWALIILHKWYKEKH